MSYGLKSSFGRWCKKQQKPPPPNYYTHESQTHIHGKLDNTHFSLNKKAIKQ